MKKGVFAVIGASFLYGIMPVITKNVLMEGLNSASTVFYRLFGAFIFSFIYIKFKGLSLKITARQKLQLAFFGTVGFGATAALLTVAYEHIPTGLGTMLHFTYPLFVTLIMWAVFKEKPNTVKIISCIMAFAGLGLMADFSRLSMVGIITAICSGITYAIYVVSNKKGNFSSLDGVVVIFYVSGFASIFFGIKALAARQLMLPPSVKSVFTIAFISLFCTVVALGLLTFGIRTLGASTAAVLNMLEPITSVFAGLIVYKETLSLTGALGCALVVFSSLVVAVSASKTSKVKIH